MHSQSYLLCSSLEQISLHSLLYYPQMRFILSFFKEGLGGSIEICHGTA